MNRLRPLVGLKVSIVQHHQGLHSLLLEEVQETVSNCLQKMKWMRNISFEVNRRLESSFGQERKGSSLRYRHVKGV